MQKVLISVVIPIYNCEKYLEKCLDSVIKSNLKEIEILLIDNNSSDNSKQICLNYEKKDYRVKYLFEEKKGSGNARNKGLFLSRGDYITFIDADDYIEESMLIDSYEFAKENNLDIVHFGSISHNITETKNSYIPYINREVLEQEKILEDYIPLLFSSVSEKNYTHKLVRAMWGKLFKKDLISKNKIKFSTHTNGQDFLFTLELSCKAERIGILKKGYYHYRNNIKGTLSKRYTSDRFYRILKLEEDLKKVLIDNKKFTKQVGIRFNRFRRHDVFWVLRMILSEDNKENIFKQYFLVKEVIDSKICEEIFYSLEEDLLFQQRILYFLIRKKLSLLLSILIKIKGFNI